MSVITSTLESRMNNRAAASTMPRSFAVLLTRGSTSRMGSPLETARLHGRPDAVDECRPARVAQTRRHDRQHLLHVQHVLRVARPRAVLELVPDAEAIHVVRHHLR